MAVFFALFSMVLLSIAGIAMAQTATPASNDDPMQGTYSIGPNGDYESFSAALSDIYARFVAGDILFEIEPGIYEERLQMLAIQLPNFQLTPYRTIFRSKSDNPEDVILRAGGGSGVNYVVTMNINLRGITFEGFTIESTHSNTQLIEVNGLSHAFRGMVFRNGNLFGAAYSTGIRIEDNEFINSGIVFVGSGTVGSFRILNNHFSNGRVSLNNTRVGPIIIANNVIQATQDAINVRGNRATAHIYNNYIRVEGGNNRHGMWLADTDSVVVFHNTVKTIGHGSTLWLTNGGNYNIKNNIFFSTLGRLMDIAAPDQVKMSADHNGYYTMGTNAARIGTVNYTNWNAFLAVMEEDENSIYADPEFDFAGDGYIERMRPHAASFADAGKDLRDTVPDDILGNERPENPSLGALQTVGTGTSIPGSEAAGIPTIFSLDGNYPNPFNPTTIIRYSLPEAADISLTVFDLHGRKVATLVEGRQQAGSHTAVFNADGLASGIYLYRLRTPVSTHTGKMLLIR